MTTAVASMVCLAMLIVAAQSPPAPTLEGLDHIPIAVNDLEAAAARYRSLGFVLKPGTPHANGIRNQHAKFADGTELELITAPEPRDALTTKYRAHLAQGDGPAFLAFHAPVRFPVPEGLGYVFFGGLNRSPTDRPEHFVHANGAEALVGVWLAADDFSRERGLLRAAGATVTREGVRVPEPMVAEVARLGTDEVVLLPAARQLIPGRRIIGATVRVKSAAAVRDLLAAARLAPHRVTFDADHTSVFLPPTITHGLWLELREKK